MEERERTNRLVAIVVGVLVAILGGYGVWLTYLGASTAASTMRLFGQELSTMSVGVACSLPVSSGSSFSVAS
jgi:uncharacterized membrane protein (DUF441 family)